MVRSKKVPESDHLYQYGLDIPRNRVYLSGSITRLRVMKTIQNLSVLARQSADPIQLIINSDGGNMAQGFALIDYMNSIPNPVHGIVLGECCSAALVILQACKNRSAGENSVFMTHTGTRENEFDLLIDRRADKIIADRMQWSLSRLDKFHSHDRYLTAQKALEMGLIDNIMEVVSK